MNDAPPRVTAAALIAAVEAKEDIAYPPRMNAQERANVARAMQYFMARDDLSINEAGALLRLGSRKMPHLCAKEIGLKSSESAIRRIQIAIIRNLSPEAVERGREKRWGSESCTLAQRRAERDVLDRRIHDMRLNGTTRAAICAALGITNARLKAACARMGAVADQTPKSGRVVPVSEKAKALQARQERQARQAEELRELAQRMPVRFAARQMGLTDREGDRLAYKFGIRSPVVCLPPRRATSQVIQHTPQSRSVVAVEVSAKPMGRNPRMTPAQQANADRMRQHTGWLLSGPAVRYPAPSREEAERLIAEAIAAGKVTKCPPMCAAPINNGRGF